MNLHERNIFPESAEGIFTAAYLLLMLGLAFGPTTAQATEALTDPATTQADVKPWGIRMDVGYTRDDNVSRSSGGKLSDNMLSLNLGKGAVIPVSEHTRIVFNGLLGGEKFINYNGLGRVFGGVQGEFMYRASGEFSAATWAIFGRAFVDQYQSALRDGSRFSAGLSARKPVTDRITLFGAVAKNVRNGKNSVFDIKDTALRMNVDYELGAYGALYVSAEQRRGDIAFSDQSSSYIGAATAYAVDDVFTDAPYYAYRMKGKTTLATLGYNMPFGSHNSIDFSWRRVRSVTDSLPGYSIYGYTTYSASYTTNQLSIALLTAF